MSWYDTEGKCPYNAVFSKTRYTRNLAGIPFPRRAGEKFIEPYLSRIEALLIKNGFRKESFASSESPYLLSLAEKGFADADIISGQGDRAVYFNEPCSLAVAVGGRDLISICSLLSGKALADTRNIASGAEELLDSEFEFAYTDHAGYISSIPSKCGSGADFSVMLYLPALSELGEIHKKSLLCRRESATLSRAFVYSEGDLFTVSHSPSHKQSETLAAEGFEALIDKLIEEERTLERIIFAEKSKIIIEKAWRAFGTLLYAKSLEEKELLALSSCIRFALSATDGQADLPPIAIKELNYLLGEGLNASVVARKPNCSSLEDCNRERAATVSELLASNLASEGK